MNTIRKRLSGVKGGRFAQACAPAQVFSIVLSDILGDPLDMIASGPAVPDTSTCGQAIAIAEKYRLRLSIAAQELLRQETPKALTNVTTRITGSVRGCARQPLRPAVRWGMSRCFSPTGSAARHGRRAASLVRWSAPMRAEAGSWLTLQAARPWCT